MADDIRSRAGLPPREEAARRLRDGAASRGAAGEALSQEEYRRRVMEEMARRRAAQTGAPPAPAASGAPPSIPEPPRPSSVRPVQDLRIPEPPRPSAVRSMREVATPTGPVAGRGGRSLTPRGGVIGLAAGAAPLVLGALEEPLRRRANETMDRRAAEEAAAGQRRLRSRTAVGMEGEGGDAAAYERTLEEMRRGLPERPAPRPTPARPTAPARREMSAERLNQLASGDAPRNAEESMAVERMRARQRELGERGTAFKKGGMVKAKQAPKKMMKGGVVTKPKSAAKTKAKAAPAFKKGGMVTKGKK